MMSLRCCGHPSDEQWLLQGTLCCGIHPGLVAFYEIASEVCIQGNVTSLLFHVGENVTSDRSLVMRRPRGKTDA